MAVSLSDVEYRSLADFRHRLRSFLAFSEREAREHGLNPQQHQLLLAARGYAKQKPTVGFLAERLLLKHHSTVELVDRLEQRQLLKRTRDATDRRQAHVVVTERGERALHELSLVHRQELSRAAPHLVAALKAVIAQSAAKKPRTSARKANSKAKPKPSSTSRR